MMLKTAFCFTFLFLIGLVSAAPATREGSVYVLDGTNFEEEVKKHEFMLVEFYAPWCGHCKRLEPEYASAAQSLEGEGSNIALAKVDATEDANKAVASRYEVRGYPTLKIFRGNPNSPEPYEGPREADGIIRYLKKRSGPAVQDLGTDTARLDRLVASSRVLVAGFFREPLAASRTYENFKSVAVSLRDDFDFVSLTDESKASEHGVKVPGIAIFKKFDEKLAVFEGDMHSIDAIKEFVQENGRPLAIRAVEGAVDQSDLDYAFQNSALKIILFVNGADRNRANMYTKRVSTVAKNYKGKAIFIVADGVKGAGNVRPDVFGLSGATSDLPLMVALDTVSNLKYVNPNRAEKAYKVAAMKEFVEAALEGDLEPFLKSEEPPALNDGPVTVVTGTTFDEIVMDPEKAVLVEMYAPWCGHCKKLAPVYEKVGAKFADQDDVVIAKIDATANDIPVAELQPRGYPTIKMVTKGNKIIDYTGDRSQSDLVSFVKKNRS